MESQKATVTDINERMVCPKCGVNSSCQCGVKPITRSLYAVLKNPEKSDRAIAEEIGVSDTTVLRARRKSTASPEAVEKRVGRDGKKRKQPTKKSTPKKVGWTVAMLDEFNGDLPVGFSQDQLGRKEARGGVRATIAERLGRPVPDFLKLKSAEAAEIAAIIRDLIAEKNPKAAAARAEEDSEEATAEVESLSAQVPENKREQWKSLTARYEKANNAVLKAKLAELQADFFQTVEAEIEKRLPKEEKRRVEEARQAAKAAKELEAVWRHRMKTAVGSIRIFMDNWRTLIGCLHPDRADHGDDEARRDRMNKASDIVTRTKEGFEKADYTKWF